MLLIDRKMPKSCIDCVCNNDDYRCNMTGDELDYDISWTGRMPNCPLKEEERKTGKWIQDPNSNRYRCDQCLSFALRTDDGQENLSDFCPVCGSIMGGKQNGT